MSVVIGQKMQLTGWQNGDEMRNAICVDTQTLIDVRSPYVTPEFNNELQCNVGNMWENYLVFICIENHVT